MLFVAINNLVEDPMLAQELRTKAPFLPHTQSWTDRTGRVLVDQQPRQGVEHMPGSSPHSDAESSSLPLGLMSACRG